MTLLILQEPTGSDRHASIIAEATISNFLLSHVIWSNISFMMLTAQIEIMAKLQRNDVKIRT